MNNCSQVESDPESEYSTCVRFAFTLSEIILSMALFAGITLSLLGLFLSSRSADRAGVVNAQAANLAQTELAKLKSKPYSVLVGYTVDQPASYPRTWCDTEYRVSPQVVRLASDPASADYLLLDVAIELKWRQNRVIDQDQKNRVGAGASEVRQIMHTVLGP